jgi:uncharacterized protein YlaI
MNVNCMMCRKAYEIDPRDTQYNKLKSGKTKFYICHNCNRGVQGEASVFTGINPNQLDEHDRILKK